MFRLMVNIPALVARADAYAKRTKRSSGGVSKAIFDDVRTLDMLRDGATNITIGRLERAEGRMADLENEQRKQTA